MPFILEGLVTTIDSQGGMHLAPMGPHVDGPDFTRFELRPFPSSQTFQNLKRHGEGVLHVTDDVVLLARAAIGASDPMPPSEEASAVRGFVLADCCRYYEFRVTAIDEAHERVQISAEVVRAGRKRDFFGFNRAKHAVVEAAILSTRIAILPAQHIASEFARLKTVVDKTGGRAEHEAFALLTEFVRPRAWSATGVRVTTGNRLHFGLLRLPPEADWPDDGRRYFGGAGLMIDAFGTRVSVSPAESWTSIGPLAERAQRAAVRIAAAFKSEAAFAVRVEQCAPEHAGLGAGTQLEVAVATAVSRALGRCDDAASLAGILGRGERSAVGLHGFAHGGFIVDGGKRRSSELGSLAARLECPPEWRIVLFAPEKLFRWHGDRERSAFLAIGAWADRRLEVLLMDHILPALAARNLAEFGAALSEYNARAGECFRSLQGGCYAHPDIQEMVSFLRANGAAGVGQSSWGPAVFAFAQDEIQAGELLAQLKSRWTSGALYGIAAARNCGAAIETF